VFSADFFVYRSVPYRLNSWFGITLSGGRTPSYHHLLKDCRCYHWASAIGVWHAAGWIFRQVCGDHRFNTCRWSMCLRYDIWRRMNSNKILSILFKQNRLSAIFNTKPSQWEIINSFWCTNHSASIKYTSRHFEKTNCKHCLREDFNAAENLPLARLIIFPLTDGSKNPRFTLSILSVTAKWDTATCSFFNSSAWRDYYFEQKICSGDIKNLSSIHW
jgi:hypothetical protein